VKLYSFLAVWWNDRPGSLKNCFPSGSVGSSLTTGT
jgi:hypothetical protein